MIGIKCNRIILINIIFYSTNNNKIDLEEQLIDFYHLYFIKTECSADLARFLLSFIQTYITDNDNFNIDFVDVWNKEIKIFIKEKFPMNKNGQFIENSDIIFLIQLIEIMYNKIFSRRYRNKKENKFNDIIKTSFTNYR